MDASGNGWISDAIRCYDYCTNADTQVISNSWGVYESSAALQVRGKGTPFPDAAVRPDRHCQVCIEHDVGGYTLCRLAPLHPFEQCLNLR